MPEVLGLRELGGDGAESGTLAGDGEPIDAYVLGVDVPVEVVTGTVVGVIERADDVEDKLVVAVAGSGPWSTEAITEAVRGWWSSSASSPTQVPGPISATFFLLRRTSAVPLMIT